MSSGPPSVDPSAAPRVVRGDVDDLTAQVCELAGHVHAATAELVGLLGRLDAIGGWQGPGIRSVGHWASIYLGIDLRTAAHQAKVGRQLETLPAIAAAAAAGELGWSKLRLVAQVAEPTTETKWLDLAREMSVGQLARVVGAYRRAADADDPDRSENHRERRGVWLFDEPDGLVRVTGLLEPDDAAVLRAALAAMGERLWRHVRRDPDTDTGRTRAASESREDAESDELAGADVGQPARLSEVDPTLAARDPAASKRVDALVALARAALAAGGVPDDGDDLTEVLVVVDHDVLTLGCEVGRCQIHNGPAIGSQTARRLCCDALIRPLIHRDGQPPRPGPRPAAGQPGPAPRPAVPGRPRLRLPRLCGPPRRRPPPRVLDRRGTHRRRQPRVVVPPPPPAVARRPLPRRNGRRAAPLLPARRHPHPGPRSTATRSHSGQHGTAPPPWRRRPQHRPAQRRGPQRRRPLVVTPTHPRRALHLSVSTVTSS